MAKDVFISHSSQDHATAAVVCDCLEARGLKCWIAPRDILPGERWGESIVHALDECRILVLMLTARANASRHVVREVERADGKLARIVTFRLEDVALNPSLEYFLSAEHWLDAMSRPVEAHLPTLVDAVQSLRGLTRPQGRAPAQAKTAESRPAAISDRDLINTFDELAPDDWNSLPQGKIASLFRGLFADR